MAKIKWTRIHRSDRSWSAIIVRTPTFGDIKADAKENYVYLCRNCGHQEVLSRFTPISHRILTDGDFVNYIKASVRKHTDRRNISLSLDFSREQALGNLCCSTAQIATEIKIELVSLVHDVVELYMPWAERNPKMFRGYYKGELMSTKLKLLNEFVSYYADHFTVMVKHTNFDYIFNRKALRFIPIPQHTNSDKYTTNHRGTFIASHMQLAHGKKQNKIRYTSVLFGGSGFGPGDIINYPEVRKALANNFANGLELSHLDWRPLDYAIEKYVPGFHSTYCQGPMFNSCMKPIVLRFLHHMAAKRPRTPRALASCFIMRKHVKPSTMRLLQSFLSSSNHGKVQDLLIASRLLKDTNLVVRLTENCCVGLLYDWADYDNRANFSPLVTEYFKWIISRVGESLFVNKVIEASKVVGTERRPVINNMSMMVVDGARLWNNVRRTRMMQQLVWKFDFEHLHDEFSRLYEILQRGPGIDIHPRNKKEEAWNCKYEDFEFFLPNNTDVLGLMGKKLKNCIGGYRNDVVSGNTRILGVKERGTLVAAFEIKKGFVRQFFMACNQRVPAGSPLMETFGKWCKDHDIHPDNWYQKADREAVAC